jgi:hypothetical protein
MTMIIAPLGLVITGFGALIAYFQWRTAHQRVVLELFERRVKVFVEFENAARDALNAVDMRTWLFGTLLRPKPMRGSYSARR